MNKLYVSALALSLIAGTASAQSQESSRTRVLKQRMTEQPAHHVQPAYSADRDLIWSDDFSDPSTWVIGNISDPNNENWVIGTTGSTGAYTIGTIESTSAANGFALFDSDLLCGGSQNAWIRTANPIDLSSYSGVVLQFEQYYREFQGMCYVETSTSDMGPWTPMQINDIGGNSTTANPQVMSINLSAAIGGQANAYFRFRYEGGCDYAWMIDDVAIITLPEHDLIMDYGYTAQFGGGYEYARVPASQMPTTMDAGAAVINFGAEDQTNVSVSVSVRDESDMEVASATSDVVALMVNGDTAVFETPLTFSPALALGTYTAYFTMNSDQIGMDENVNDNSRNRYFAVTSDLYSLDGLDVIPDDMLSLSSVGTNSFTDNTQDVRLLNYFEVPNTTIFYGVEVYLSGSTVPGSYFIAAVYDTADVLANTADLTSPLVESDPRLIEQADMDNGQLAAVSFLNPITLGPGAYFVSANMYQEGGNDMRIIDDETVPQPAIASMLWIPVDDQSQFLYGGNGTAWAVRLSSLLNVGVQDSPSLKGITMYPSPTTGPLEVRAETPGNMTVEVFNALGEKVMTSSFTGTATTLNLAGNAAGMYTVRIGDGTNFNMQRVVRK